MANSEVEVNYKYQNKITGHLLKSNTDRAMGPKGDWVKMQKYSCNVLSKSGE